MEGGRKQKEVVNWKVNGTPICNVFKVVVRKADGVCGNNLRRDTWTVLMM